MLDHPIIDETPGLVSFYVVLSLVASAVQECLPLTSTAALFNSLSFRE